MMQMQSQAEFSAHADSLSAGILHILTGPAWYAGSADAAYMPWDLIEGT